MSKLGTQIEGVRVTSQVQMEVQVHSVDDKMK